MEGEIGIETVESNVPKRPEIQNEELAEAISGVKNLNAAGFVKSLKNVIEIYELPEGQIGTIMACMDDAENLGADDRLDLMTLMAKNQKLPPVLLEEIMLRVESLGLDLFRFKDAICKNQNLSLEQLKAIIGGEGNQKLTKGMVESLKLPPREQYDENLMTEIIINAEKLGDELWFPLMKNIIFQKYGLSEFLINAIMVRAENLSRECRLEFMGFIAQETNWVETQIDRVTSFVAGFYSLSSGAYVSALASLIKVIVAKENVKLTSDQIEQIMLGVSSFGDEVYFNLMNFISQYQAFSKGQIDKIVCRNGGLDNTGKLVTNFTNNLGINLMKGIVEGYTLSLEQILEIIIRAGNIVRNKDDKDEKYKLIKFIAENQDFSEGQIDKIIEIYFRFSSGTHYADLMKVVVKYKELSPHQFKKIMEGAEDLSFDSFFNLMESMVQNQNLSLDQFEEIMKRAKKYSGICQEEYSSLEEAADQNQKLNNEKVKQTEEMPLSESALYRTGDCLK